MKVRKAAHIDENPPDYGPHPGKCTLCIHYGGQLNSDLDKWVGGSVIKYDYCQISKITLPWLLGYTSALLHLKSQDIVLYGRKSDWEYFSVIRNDGTLRGNVLYDELKVYVVQRSVAEGLGYVDEEVIQLEVEVEDEDKDSEDDDILGESKTQGLPLDSKTKRVESKRVRNQKSQFANRRVQSKKKSPIQKVDSDDSDSVFDSDDEDYEDDESDSEGDKDDMLFSKNTDTGEEWMGFENHNGVDEELREESGGEQGHIDDAESGDEDLLLSDEDFPTYVSGDEECEGERAPVYVRSQNNSPAFALGMVFSTKKEFRDLVDAHSIIECRSIYYTKSDKNRVYAKCAREECNFRINLRRRGTDSSFEITTLYGEHTCITEYNVKNMNSNWLAERYGYQWKGDKNRSIDGFRTDMIRETRCHVTWWQAYLCKRKALMTEKVDVVGEYALLWNYANEIRRTNPGSTVLVGVEQVGNENKFSRFYVCLSALKQGFLRGCRPLFGVDGTFCKGPYGGILLTAIGYDANNNLFPIAWAVVSKEDGNNWEWFLRNLKSDLEIVRDHEWTIISDKQKGLIRAVTDIFPSAAHRFCVQHLHSNFMNAGFRGHGFKVALWRAAKATTVNEFARKMGDMKKLDVKAYEWLNEKHPEQWSRSHFGTTPKCDTLLNNICESFNSMILESRVLPILSMLESIFSIVMKRIRKCRDRGERWKGPFCPKIKKVIDFNSSKLPDCQPFKSSDIHYQVSCHDGTQYAVDLEKMTCGCRKWDLTGIPCKHAISAINCQKLSVEGFVHGYYRLETYRETYKQCIMPMNGRGEWPISEAIPHLPPKLIRQAGRPPKARRREPDEPMPKRKRKAAGRPPNLVAHTKKRVQETLTCGRCGEKGHNRRSCVRREGHNTRELIDEEDEAGGVENEYQNHEPQMEGEASHHGDEGMASQMRSQPTQEDPPQLDDEIIIDDDYLREIEEIIKSHSSSQPAPDSTPSQASQAMPQYASQPALSQVKKVDKGKQKQMPSRRAPRQFQPQGPVVKEVGSKFVKLSREEASKAKGKNKKME